MLRNTTMLALVAALALGGSVAALAQGSGLNGHDSKAPVDFDADHMDLLDKQQRVLLSGSVVIKQGDLKLQADRTIVDYIDQGGIKAQRIDALGHVRVTRGSENATADVANYDLNKRIITLVGNVVLQRDKDITRGNRLVIDLAAHHSGFVGAAGKAGAAGRVTGSFSVAESKK